MRYFITFAALALFSGACSQPQDSDASTHAQAPAAKMSETARINEFFEDAFMEGVMRNPMFQDFLGVRKDQDKWPDISDERAKENLEITRSRLAELRSSFDVDKLDETARLSYKLFERRAEEQIEDFRFRFHNYPVNQMFGLQSGAPAHLINMHRISEVQDAENYIARLEGMDDFFAQLVKNLQKREELGIVAPKFAFPYVVNDSRAVLTGAPFDDSDTQSTLLADFAGKIDKLEIDADTRAGLMARAEKALLENVRPAYEHLIGYVEDVATRAGTDDGAWRLPDGAEFYRNRLKRTTTTDMTPEEVHSLGLSEVARIHDEMREIMRAVGYEGTLQEFFVFMREDKQFYYEDTDEGRQAYLDEAVSLIDTMRGRLDEMFNIKPKADIVVKAVEPFREASAGKAFYNRPAPDGSRPGTYYANLYRMDDMPTYQMEALAYHEGIPGHHMQIAIAQELEGIPTFRKWARYTAYTEGWGLYTEMLPKEFGFYADPYSDFGRLAMELWRACRLVVDSGIHDKRWTREQAIEYLRTNTPNAEGDVIKAIERYIVMPGQATAYKVGMIKILALREQAREALGERFDLREFHDVVLGDGPVPLAVLEELVLEYIADKS